MQESKREQEYQDDDGMTLGKGIAIAGIWLSSAIFNAGLSTRELLPSVVLYAASFFVTWFFLWYTKSHEPEFMKVYFKDYESIVLSGRKS